MTEGKSKALCDKYPKIFKKHTESGTRLRASGFDHGDGWYDILDAACANIQHHVDWKRKKEPFASMTDEEFDEIHQPTAVQVKEKFGGLRFYVDGCDDHVQGIICMAESMSYRVCEECGSLGKKRPGGWIRTLCDRCADSCAGRSGG